MQFTFNAYGIDMLSISGPDPFDSNATRNSSAIGVTTVTLDPGANVSTIIMVDDDTNLHDGDSAQELAQSVFLNGQNFGPGTDIEIEYSYFLMPVGSTDPADGVTIYAVEFNGTVQAVTYVGTFRPGVTYRIQNGGSDDPSVSYDQLPICFLRGTLVLTAQGLRPVQDLREGDRVQTLDHGLQPVRWVFSERMGGQGQFAPVRVAKGALGNSRTLFVSPQHRLLMPGRLLCGEEALMAAKALTGLPGVRHVPMTRVEWWHILFDRHEVILADGIGAESLLPGPQVWRGLAPLAQASLARVWSVRERMAPARRLIAPGRFARLGVATGAIAPRAGACKVL